MKIIRICFLFFGLGAAVINCRLPGEGGPEIPDVRSEFGGLSAADPENGGEFGKQVAIDGDTAVCAAHNDAGGNTLRCAAYVFYRNQGGPDHWGQVKKITVSDVQEATWYETAVAVSGDYAVIGSPFVNGAGTYRGAVYVYGRNQGGADNWGLVKKLTSPTPEDQGYFGFTLGLDGGTLVVGAFGEGALGRAHVFYRDRGGADNWGYLKALLQDPADTCSSFGYAVGVAGDHCAVTTLGTGGTGYAHVFERNLGGADAWGERKMLVPSTKHSGDECGWSVAVGGGFVALGARSDNGAGTDRGAVFIFARNQGGADTWGEVKKIAAADGRDDDLFGSTVAVSGDYITVGASWDDTTQAPDREAAYLFYRNEGGADQWGQAAKFTATDGSWDDEFGCAVAASGSIVIVGAYQADGAGTGRGAAYLFTIP